jgi:hypothetical protein
MQRTAPLTRGTLANSPLERRHYRGDKNLPVIEVALSGTVAYRVGKRVEWDAANMTVTSLPDADLPIGRENRKG